MPSELKVPAVGESVTEVQIGTWLKQKGESVSIDEAVVEIESDKATVELPSPVGGVITEVLKSAGEMAAVGEVIGYVDESAAPAAAAPASSDAPTTETPSADAPASKGNGHVMPSAQRVLSQAGVDAASVAGSGPGGRVLKEDALRAAAAAAGGQSSAPAPAPAPAGSRAEEVVPMSMLRRRIAENLVGAQQTAALLTTFNEIDMGAAMSLRKEYRDSFEKRHGVRLGFMSFFVKACVDALREFPAINAEVRGNEIVYKHYQDIGIAVGGGKGLVVPILRNAEAMGFAEVEQTIGDFGRRAKDNKIGLDELQGGTFTISNGGVYGSLLSTPIVNPPQSGILGLHKIEERPVAVDGQVVVRPMMYVALTYDHRIVDGREAVGFLVRVKECLENPTRMLLEI